MPSSTGVGPSPSNARHQRQPHQRQTSGLNPCGSGTLRVAWRSRASGYLPAGGTQRGSSISTRSAAGPRCARDACRLDSGWPRHTRWGTTIPLTRPADQPGAVASVDGPLHNRRASRLQALARSQLNLWRSSRWKSSVLRRPQDRWPRWHRGAPNFPPQDGAPSPCLARARMARSADLRPAPRTSPLIVGGGRRRISPPARCSRRRRAWPPGLSVDRLQADVSPASTCVKVNAGSGAEVSGHRQRAVTLDRDRGVSLL